MKKKINTRGFTLIEVMIVVAIIAILAGIAYPSYMESVRKSNRSDAKVALNDTAQRLQRCFTTYNAYNNANCSIASNLDSGGTLSSPEGFYNISGTVTANDFSLTATPVVGGVQANDAKCETFTLNKQGARGATGSDPSNCW